MLDQETAESKRNRQTKFYGSFRKKRLGFNFGMWKGVSKGFDAVEKLPRKN
jgi:hypothetical protein